MTIKEGFKILTHDWRPSQIERERLRAASVDPAAFRASLAPPDGTEDNGDHAQPLHHGEVLCTFSQIERTHEQQEDADQRQNERHLASAGSMLGNVVDGGTPFLVRACAVSHGAAGGVEPPLTCGDDILVCRWQQSRHPMAVRRVDAWA
jgi:hypothetical protein